MQSAGSSGPIAADRPVADRPGHMADERHAGNRAARPEPVTTDVESSQLPGILGSTVREAGDSPAGVDVPTGPMERFVRPSDRDAARAAARHADAEANAMERVMREGQRPGPTGGAHSAAVGPDAHPAGRALQMPDHLRSPAAGRSGTAKAGGMLGGLIRPRRHPQHQGVYDAELDD